MIENLFTTTLLVASSAFAFPNHGETSFGQVTGIEKKSNYEISFKIDEKMPPVEPLPTMGDLKCIFYFETYNTETKKYERYAEAQGLAQMFTMYDESTKIYSGNISKASLIGDSAMGLFRYWTMYDGNTSEISQTYLDENLRNLGFYIEQTLESGSKNYINVVPLDKNYLDEALQNAYDEGYKNGLSDGYDEAWQTGYNTGKEFGLGQGYDKGYNDGYKNGVSESDEGVADGVFGMLGRAFTSVGSILSIEVFENVTLGTLLLVPLTIAIIFTISKLLGL